MNVQIGYGSITSVVVIYSASCIQVLKAIAMAVS